jgi:hypothetical protein
MRFKVVDVTFDSSYPTGGEAVTAADLGWDQVHGAVVLFDAKNSAGTAVLPVVAVPNSTKTQVTLQLYRYDGASAGKANLEEAAAAFNASAFTARIKFLGT